MSKRCGPSFHREKVIFLMEAFSHSRLGLPPKALKRLNACRTYLQVLTLTDICDGSGNFICLNSLKGQRHLDRKSLYNWATQERPSLKAWLLWNRTIRKVFCKQKRGLSRLIRPLGRWLSFQPYHQVWHHFIDTVTQSLIRQAQGAEIFCIHAQSHARCLFHTEFTQYRSSPNQNSSIKSYSHQPGYFA